MAVNTRRAAATSPAELVRDVRRVVGGRPRTSADVLRKLATDRDRARHAMARHGWDIPEEDLLRLAKDSSANVRFWLANVPGSTRPVVRVLAEDPDDRIAVSARQWLRKPPRRGGFPNPAQLGRPIVEVEHHIWNQYMSRGQGQPYT
ncbi:hypothetical protein [Paractinoplanes brasiliensis]|nr:hypothetical protein [Actinoplanes brasiliensis]